VIDGDRCQIVLVEPAEGGNLGSCCRALMNCGFGPPHLVRPLVEDWAEARKMAVHAADLVSRAPRFESLEQAIAGVQWVVGVSGRPRKHPERKVPIGPADLVTALASLPEGAGTALVFGPERTGLTNAQLGLCQDVLCLPTSEQYPSLNLAHAVLVVAWTIRMAALAERAGDGAGQASGGQAPDLASAADLDGLIGHAQNTLGVIGYLDKQNPRLILDEIRKVFSRARLSLRELRMFRGVFHRMDVWVSMHAGSPTPNQDQGRDQEDGGAR